MLDFRDAMLMIFFAVDIALVSAAAVVVTH